MNPVVHFELPCEDRTRMGGFYETAFGWRIKMLGPEMGNYVLATTTETDENGPRRAGAINGGFWLKTPDGPPPVPSLVIAVDNIGAAMARVRDAGGKVLGDPMEIPGVGQFVSFLDTEGNRLGMLQPIPHNFHPTTSE